MSKVRHFSHYHFPNKHSFNQNLLLDSPLVPICLQYLKCTVRKVYDVLSVYMNVDCIEHQKLLTFLKLEMRCHQYHMACSLSVVLHSGSEHVVDYSHTILGTTKPLLHHPQLLLLVLPAVSAKSYCTKPEMQ